MIQIKKPEVVSENFEGETILVHLGTGKYFSIRFSGFFLWRLLEFGYGVDQAADLLATTYNISRGQALKDVRNFIDSLKENDLIVETEGGNVNGQIELEEKVESYETPTIESYEDMQDLLLADPIHDVDEEKGWPHKPEAQK